MREIELAKAVEVLRNEVYAAAAGGVGERLRFEVEQIQLELTVELRADAQAKWGFRAWVITGDVQAGGAAGRTQRVTLTLKPKDAHTGTSIDLGSHRDLTSAGHTPPGDPEHGQ